MKGFLILRCGLGRIINNYTSLVFEARVRGYSLNTKIDIEKRYYE